MRQLESQEQAALFKWAAFCENRYPELFLLHAIPNGGKRDIVTAVRLKATGLKPGVPDVFLPVSRKGFHGLYIEMKIKGGRLSDNQKKWISEVEHQGYLVLVCYNWQEASNEIVSYLGEGN